MSKKAVIIGAGPAGLTAAYDFLKKTDIKPVILEKSNDIGGISKTVKYNGNRMDIGGHRFFSKNEDVVNTWLEVMPLQGKGSYDDIKLAREVPINENGPDPEKEDKVMLNRNRVSRIYYLKKFFDYPISLKAQTFKNMGFKNTMRAGFGYIGSRFHKRKDESNLENFYINRFGKPLYQMFFEKYTTKLWGRSPKEIDSSWGAQRVKGLSLTKVVWDAVSKPFRRKNSKKVETSLIESFYYPKMGPGQLYESMADIIKDKGGAIEMNKEVAKIHMDGKRVKNIELTNGEIVEGDYFISSMPLKDLVLAMDSGVSEEVRNIAGGLIYRDFITVGLLVNKLNLKNETKFKTLNNIVPDTWIYVQEADVKLGRIQIFNNWSPYMVKDPDNTVWIGLEYFVDEGDEYWNMKDEDFIAFATKELVSMGVINEEDVIDAHEERIQKAYPAYFDTYKDIDKVIEFINSIENLYCIGRNGQHRYNNMDHSMLTAMECVNSIIDPTKVNKETIWKVNTEQEYHEEKK